jgi:DNA-3-methyladenine glycosylase I
VKKTKTRCFWCGEDPLYIKYHDHEWGRPIRDDHKLFEQLTLEGAQAGLSWLTILRKRENYRKAFAKFDPKKVARFKEAKIEKLIFNQGIIRHRGKIVSTVNNAKIFLSMQKEYGSFSDWLWNHARENKVKHHRQSTTSPLAIKISKDLKKRGMKFVGPSIMHAFLQAVGVFSDHQPECWKFAKKHPRPSPTLKKLH